MGLCPAFQKLVAGAGAATECGSGLCCGERQIMAKIMMQRYFVSVGLLTILAASAHAQVAPTPATDPNAIRVLLSPELETTLVSQMVGRIATLNAQLGGPVSKGRVIVGFDCGEASAKVRMAQAEYDSALKHRR